MLSRLGPALILLMLPVGAPAAVPGGARPGVVFVAGGIGGMDPLQVWAPLAFDWAGVPHEVCVFEWTHGVGRPFLDLCDHDDLLAQARKLADAVARVKAQAPDRPVYLVGHSAGAGLCLAAAELLPPGHVERVVLLSAAVSAEYDLRPALRRTTREIVSFHSTFDRVNLHLGTTLFGTVDRVFGAAAGLDGFRPPEGIDEEGRCLYGRLVQVGWGPECLLEGHGGWHHSTTMPGFLALQVAPWLMPPLPRLETAAPRR
jgi:pimeloyl-ACP methyl ester carboxylesterase